MAIDLTRRCIGHERHRAVAGSKKSEQRDDRGADH